MESPILAGFVSRPLSLLLSLMALLRENSLYKNYGVFSWFSAISALLFTPLFGILSDRIASSQGREICAGAGCYSSAFYVSAVSSTLAAFLCIYLLTTTWNGRV